MKITYNIAGSARKEFVSAIAHLLAVASVYQGPPSFAYDIGGYIVDKNGNLETPEGATTNDIFRLVDALFAEYNYKPEESLSNLIPDEEKKDSETEEEPEEEPKEATEEETADSITEPANEPSKESEPEAADAPEIAPETGDSHAIEDVIDEATKAPENAATAPQTGEEPVEDEATETPADDAVSAEPDQIDHNDHAEEAQKDDPEDNKLTLSFPKQLFSPAAIDRLKSLVSSKQTLLKKVFNAEELPIVLTDDHIQFPWFTLQHIDGEVDAYAKFIHAIAVRALTSSRISSYEKPTDNDKFTMRLFLNNLGFKGEEFKFARRFLIRNLDGNGAWRYGSEPDASNFELEMPTVVKGDKKEPNDNDVGNGKEESSDERSSIPDKGDA